MKNTAYLLLAQQAGGSTVANAAARSDVLNMPHRVPCRIKLSGMNAAARALQQPDRLIPQLVSPHTMQTTKKEATP